MGTRGLVAYTYKGKIYGMYNHFDSYPTGLGNEIKENFPKLVKILGLDTIKKKVLTLKKQNEKDETNLSQEQIDQYYLWKKTLIESQENSKKELHTRMLNDQLTNEEEKDYSINYYKKQYYPLTTKNTYLDLLQKTEPDFTSPFIFGIINNELNFGKDSLFCEWGYVFDFDREVLEIYRGFIQYYHQNGRFADKTDLKKEYYPIELKFEIPFDQLHTNWPEDIETYENEVANSEYDEMKLSPHQMTDLVMRISKFIYKNK